MPLGASSRVFAPAAATSSRRPDEFSAGSPRPDVQTSFRWVHLVQTSFRTSRLSFRRNYEEKSAWKALKMPAAAGAPRGTTRRLGRSLTVDAPRRKMPAGTPALPVAGVPQSFPVALELPS